MWRLRSPTSHWGTGGGASLIWALPLRSDLTSDPRSTMPASTFSIHSNLCRARRLVATSPEAGARFFPFLAIHRLQLDSTACCFNPTHPDGYRIAEPQLATGLLADQRRLALVQLEALSPTQAAGRQEALVNIAELAAEADEGAGADQPRNLAREDECCIDHAMRGRCSVRSCASLAQLALEQESGADVVGPPLDAHRLALTLAAVPGSLARFGSARCQLALAQRSQQGTVDDEVRVAPDRRGEMTVGGAAEPGVAAVALAVLSLFEGTQHKRCIRGATVPASRSLLHHQAARLSRKLGRLARRGRAAQWRRRDLELVQLRDQPFYPRRIRPSV